MSDTAPDLDPRLQATGVVIARLALCAVILKQDARWPWVILAPQRGQHVREIHHLIAADRILLMEEIAAASRAVSAEAGVEKINVAALGNQVAQLHVHVIGRWVGDPAWPHATFGAPGKTAYADDAFALRARRLTQHLLAPPQ